MGNRRKNGKPTKADLSALEKTFKADLAKRLKFGTPTDPEKLGELNEARSEFRRAWNEMRRQVLDQYEADAEELRRIANPPASDEQLQRMGLLSGVHLPVWQRSPGNLPADAISFEQQGDEAGLRLARQHVGLLQAGQRSKMAASIDEALSDFKSPDQRKAEQQVHSLEGERSRFEIGTGMRSRGMIAALAGAYKPSGGSRIPLEPEPDATQVGSSATGTAPDGKPSSGAGAKGRKG